MWTEERTQGSASNPDFGMCCNHGRVDLPPLPDPPDEIRDLYTGTNEMARDFRQFIRQYNCALAFTSLGVEIDHSVNNGRGPYVFKIRGGLRHLSGPLSPPEGMPPSFSQLYVYDPEAALNQRKHRNRNLHQATMEVLQTTLTRDHQYARAYRRAHEVLEEEEVDEIILRLESDPAQDQRRYNLPTADEIAAIIPGDGTEIRGQRDILLRKRTGGFRRIDSSNPAYAPLQYVLLFPR
ncbi:hypothetical protein OF83DRAFT_1068932, partial [Amylostereum chailletii]